MEHVLISFVIIAYNEAAAIGRAIGGISALSGLRDYEIIVINDGSQDATGRIVADLAAGDPHVRLIDLPENRGRGHARRTGIGAARGHLIATVDADIILPPDWLVRARAALEGHHAAGGTAVPDGDVAYLHQRFRLTPRRVPHTTAVTGSNALYRRETFAAVSFDPALREGEDVALNHGLRRQGLSAVTVPGLFVRHAEHKTFPASLRWLFVSGRGATRQLITYRQVRTPDLAVGAFVGTLGLGLSLWARGHRVTGAGLPAALVLTVASQHVRSRFETPRSQWARVVPAVAVDGMLLTAYFSGRLAGLAALARVRRPA